MVGKSIDATDGKGADLSNQGVGATGSGFAQPIRSTRHSSLALL
jgi:hypothetical protein